MWYAYVNGAWNLAEPLSRAALFGDGVFETIHIYRHVALFVQEHLARLSEALFVLNLTPPLSMQELAEAVKEKAALYPYARLKIVMYRKGEGAYTPSTSEAGIVIGITPYTRVEDFPWASPASVVVYPFPVNMRMPWSRFKTLSALRYVQAAAYAKAQGYADALLLSVEGYLSETSRANLFFWDGEVLHTPPLSTGCVEGVLQRFIRRLANQERIPLQETLLIPNKLASIKEVFSTNVMQGIQPIRAILHENQRLWQADEDFPLARSLAFRLKELLRHAVTDE